MRRGGARDGAGRVVVVAGGVVVVGVEVMDTVTGWLVGEVPTSLVAVTVMT